MAKRYGAVITFKEGTTQLQIVQAMNAIKDILDVPEMVDEPIYQTRAQGYRGPGARRVIGYNKVPFMWPYLVQQYDDQYGGPVWYIP